MSTIPDEHLFYILAFGIYLLYIAHILLVSYVLNCSTYFVIYEINCSMLFSIFSKVGISLQARSGNSREYTLLNADHTLCRSLMIGESMMSLFCHPSGLSNLCLSCANKLLKSDLKASLFRQSCVSISFKRKCKSQKCRILAVNSGYHMLL